MCDMMWGMFAGPMIWGMGAVGLLILALTVLAVAALAKYLFEAS
jgi:hypothetical protein